LRLRLQQTSFLCLWLETSLSQPRFLRVE